LIGSLALMIINDVSGNHPSMKAGGTHPPKLAAAFARLAALPQPVT
jgi:hypothetical protein